tara:strand:- start:4204 stop:4638 length:435 start_codon:yes stop_codon:yes gene_type:complete
MALGNRYQVGVGSVGSYQISGIPWVQTFETDTSIKEVTFAPDGTNPYVTRFIKLRNTGGSGETVKLGLHANGITGSTAGEQPWITLPHSMTEWLHLEVRVSSIYLQAASGTPNVEIIAGLTPIQNDFTENISLYRGVGTGSVTS